MAAATAGAYPLQLGIPAMRSDTSCSFAQAHLRDICNVQAQLHHQTRMSVYRTCAVNASVLGELTVKAHG